MSSPNIEFGCGPNSGALHAINVDATARLHRRFWLSAKLLFLLLGPLQFIGFSLLLFGTTNPGIAMAEVYIPLFAIPVSCVALAALFAGNSRFAMTVAFLIYLGVGAALAYVCLYGFFGHAEPVLSIMLPVVLQATLVASPLAIAPGLSAYLRLAFQSPKVYKRDIWSIEKTLTRSLRQKFGRSSWQVHRFTIVSFLLLFVLFVTIFSFFAPVIISDDLRIESLGSIVYVLTAPILLMFKGPQWVPEHGLAEMWINLLISLGGIWLVIYGLRKAWRLIKRKRQRSALSVLEGDASRPALLLRSFRDDPVAVRPKFLLSQLLSRKVRLEEVMATELHRSGPFIAIGAPGETLPELGAHRAQFQGAEWQAAVLKWLEECRFVVMIVGTTQWVRWECAQVLRTGVTDKLLLCMPPGDASETGARWKTIVECFAGSAWHAALIHCRPERTLAVHFYENGNVLAVEGSRRDQTEYELALLVALYGMLMRGDAMIE